MTAHVSGIARNIPMRLGAGVSLLLLTLLGGCAGAPGIAEPTKNATLVQGPPASDIVTPFDEAQRRGDSGTDRHHRGDVRRR